MVRALAAGEALVRLMVIEGDGNCLLKVAQIGKEADCRDTSRAVLKRFAKV